MVNKTASFLNPDPLYQIQFTTNNQDRHGRFYYFAKFIQTISLKVVAENIILSCRVIKLLTWVPAKAGLYKISGYHTKASNFLELEYLKTVKTARDILFIPSTAKRALKDTFATRESFVDDILPKRTEDYINVKYTKTFQLFSSYLHGRKTVEVIYPQGITEFAAVSDGSLKTIMASHLFKPGMMAINFGVPNVSTFITEANEDGSVQTLKVDAKSLRREEMKYHPTNGKIQSGVFLVPKNLPEEALARYKQAAEKMIGRKDITCVNTNCRVLQEAGFSIEGVAMDEVVFPNTLMQHILYRNVFYTDSSGVKHKVHFDIINTSQEQDLEKFFENIDTAVVGTRLRHRRRNKDTEENQKARGEAAKHLIKQEKESLDAQQAKQPLMEEDLIQRKVTVSVPSCLGNIAANIWGRHTIYELDLSDKKIDISTAFIKLANCTNQQVVKLKPFPKTKVDFVTRLKRDFFFSGFMIRLLRRHMMGRVDKIYLNTENIFHHLKSTKGAHLNYALLDDKIVIARVNANGTGTEKHKKAADWALSKHALLANRQDVYCSGEMWYNEVEDCYELNADSGTYTPTEEHVQIVVRLANQIFNNSHSNNRFRVAKNSDRAA